MIYCNSNLVKNKPEIFLNVNFGLKFMNDREVSHELRNHFLLQECVYPDVGLMNYMIQEYADESRDFINRLYDLQIANQTYNPVENYDRIEEWTDDTDTTDKYKAIEKNKTTQTSDSKNKGDSKESEFPMDYDYEKPVTHNSVDSTVNQTDNIDGSIDTDAERNNVVNAKHIGRTHGNIGVTTGAQMITGEIEIAKIIYSIKKEICKQYDDLFMITI